jgi:hypothetical protein
MDSSSSSEEWAVKGALKGKLFHFQCLPMFDERRMKSSTKRKNDQFQLVFNFKVFRLTPQEILAKLYFVSPLSLASRNLCIAKSKWKTRWIFYRAQIERERDREVEKGMFDEAAATAHTKNSALASRKAINKRQKNFSKKLQAQKKLFAVLLQFCSLPQRSVFSSHRILDSNEKKTISTFAHAHTNTRVASSSWWVLSTHTRKLKLEMDCYSAFAAAAAAAAGEWRREEEEWWKEFIG